MRAGTDKAADNLAAYVAMQPEAPTRRRRILRQAAGHSDQNGTAPTREIVPPALAELPEPLFCDPLLRPCKIRKRATGITARRTRGQLRHALGMDVGGAGIDFTWHMNRVTEFKRGEKGNVLLRKTNNQWPGTRQNDVRVSRNLTQIRSRKADQNPKAAVTRSRESLDRTYSRLVKINPPRVLTRGRKRNRV